MVFPADGVEKTGDPHGKIMKLNSSLTPYTRSGQRTSLASACSHMAQKRTVVFIFLSGWKKECSNL